MVKINYLLQSLYLKQMNGKDEDDFNFLESCWEVVEVDIIRDLNEFHVNGRLPRETNASFLTLIPKKQNALSVGRV